MIEWAADTGKKWGKWRRYVGWNLQIPLWFTTWIITSVVVTEGGVNRGGEKRMGWGCICEEEVKGSKWEGGDEAPISEHGTDCMRDEQVRQRFCICVIRSCTSSPLVLRSCRATDTVCCDTSVSSNPSSSQWRKESVFMTLMPHWRLMLKHFSFSVSTSESRRVSSGNLKSLSQTIVCTTGGTWVSPVINSQLPCYQLH